jgi:putative Ca2+/H+ antiporter (TMEM165/GDT1 family)
LHNFSIPDQHVDKDVPPKGQLLVEVTFPPSGAVRFFRPGEHCRFKLNLVFHDTGFFCMALQIDWKLFVSTSVLIFVAELPDKTAFATLMLMGEHWCCCFVYSIRVSDVAEKGPRRGKFPSGNPKIQFSRTIWSSFVVIFIAEWGDLTQLASATLAAEHKKPVTVFLAATLALLFFFFELKGFPGLAAHWRSP